MLSWPVPVGVITRTASGSVSPVSQVNELEARNGYSVSFARVFSVPDGSTIS